jgi:hypothetical protein
MPRSRCPGSPLPPAAGYVVRPLEVHLPQPVGTVRLLSQELAPGTTCGVGISAWQPHIDLAVSAPPDLPASATPAGPTLAPEEFADHKLLARATPTDVGFDTNVLSSMIATLGRFRTMRSPYPTARPSPNCAPSTRLGDQSYRRKPDQLAVR